MSPKPEPECVTSTGEVTRKPDKRFWIGVDAQGLPMTATAARTAERAWKRVLRVVWPLALQTPRARLKLDGYRVVCVEIDA